MNHMNIRKSLLAKVLLGMLVLVIFTESSWAILGVWRRTAVRTAVVVSSASASEAASASAANTANANAAAADAAAAQQSAAASAAAAQQAAASAASENDPQQKLEQLKSLYDQGLISQSDYEAAKTKILDQMAQ